MALRTRIVVIGLWVASVLVAGLLVHAQAPLPPREPQSPVPQPGPTVIAGNDLGFRIDSRKGRTPIGRFVVRINGEWVEIEESFALKRLTAR